MNPHQKQVREFMQAFGQETPDFFSPQEYPSELRTALIVEECMEFGKAAEENNFVEMIDAICDILYVTYGAAIAMGIDIDPFFDEVHRSNMSKLDPVTKQPVRRADGKILKPPTYSPANIKSMLFKLHGEAVLVAADVFDE
jgi:predicted HAD superfamily Cof-like phosphohydrolase